MNDRVGNIFWFMVITENMNGGIGILWCGMWWFGWGRGDDWTGCFCGRDMGYFRDIWGVLLLLLLGNFSSWLMVYEGVF
jgi:hypothetical protein